MKKPWWKESVVYQIYPRSFKDSNGDGIGDLVGIIEKLDYLKDLGVDVIWLSPVYNSPNDDNGYDISDYQSIMSEFGTIEDWDQMLDGIHARGMKLIMDLVVNHSSDEHKWFQESRKSKDNSYRNYYIWSKGKGDKEPNNWVSFFGGSAWQYDPRTNEYFLHLFSKKQPDLNWENPTLRKEIYNMMNWWLERGIDGFRMDVINLISKVDGLPSTENEDYDWGGDFFMNGPRVHQYLQEMNQEVLSKYDILTVGECPGASTADALRYANKEGSELSMIFTFEHMDLDSGPDGKFDVKPLKLSDLKNVMTKWQKELKGKAWNSLYLNNHDQPRVVSRFGDDQVFRVESAKMLATFLHMMQGTPYIYQGEEIGMTNVHFESIEDYRDLETLNYYKEKVIEGQNDPKKVIESIRIKGRDNARTPMQWDSSINAGFSEGTPWIKLNPNYNEINVEKALADQNSIYYYYKKLIYLRKHYEIIVFGIYDLILKDHDQIFAYTRTLNEERLLVVCNFSKENALFNLPENFFYQTYKLLISNYNIDESLEPLKLELRPYESCVYLLK